MLLRCPHCKLCRNLCARQEQGVSLGTFPQPFAKQKKSRQRDRVATPGLPSSVPQSTGNAGIHEILCPFRSRARGPRSALAKALLRRFRPVFRAHPPTKIRPHILPQPDVLSGQKHFVSSGRQVLPLTGVADLEPGGFVGVADTPILRVPLGGLQHTTHAAGPHPGQSSDSQVSAVARSPDTEVAAPVVPSPSPTLMER